MSADRDTARIVRSWLREDGHEDADRVLDLVLDQLDTTPQRRATWWPVWRPLTLNTSIRYGIAAVAVAVAALLGFTYINNQIGNEPTPTPSPSELSVLPLPAGLQHPFLGPPRPIPGISSEPAAAILQFDGSTFTFNTGASDVLDSTATITSSGQLKLTTGANGSTCEVGDEGLYDYSFSNGDTRLTITGTDDCAAREAAMVGTWQTSNCRNPDNFCLGDLQAGTYSSQYFEPRPLGAWEPRFGALTYTVPDGWAASSDYPEGYELITQEAYAVLDLEADGCGACPDGISVLAAPQAAAADCLEEGAAGVGTSAAELADWVEGNPNFVVERRPSVTIDGSSGIVLRVEMAEGATGLCGEAGEAGPPIFYNGWHMAVPPGDRQDYMLVDLAGGDTILIIIDTTDPAALDAIVAQAVPIIESFEFPQR
ncbi:MAG TPA: hypothetical protein VFH90_06090 [Candidatus Limnocylindria bacterium]|nr:hypothetical protein [Candidatus Limnocylindria bacterium]